MQESATPQLQLPLNVVRALSASRAQTVGLLVALAHCRGAVTHGGEGKGEPRGSVAVDFHLRGRP